MTQYRAPSTEYGVKIPSTEYGVNVSSTKYGVQRAASPSMEPEARSLHWPRKIAGPYYWEYTRVRGLGMLTAVVNFRASSREVASACRRGRAATGQKSRSYDLMRQSVAEKLWRESAAACGFITAAQFCSSICSNVSRGRGQW